MLMYAMHGHIICRCYCLHPGSLTRCVPEGCSSSCVALICFMYKIRDFRCCNRYVQWYSTSEDLNRIWVVTFTYSFRWNLVISRICFRIEKKVPYFRKVSVGSAVDAHMKSISRSLDLRFVLNACLFNSLLQVMPADRYESLPLALT